jgi:hypothetical protein
VFSNARNTVHPCAEQKCHNMKIHTGVTF